ncbi:MAG: hypothetical protein R3D45_09850 [Rhizobiaceae bacterium]
MLQTVDGAIAALPPTSPEPIAKGSIMAKQTNITKQRRVTNSASICRARDMLVKANNMASILQELLERMCVAPASAFRNPPEVNLFHVTDFERERFCFANSMTLDFIEEAESALDLMLKGKDPLDAEAD